MLTDGFEAIRTVVYLDGVQIYDKAPVRNQFGMYPVYSRKVRSVSHDLLIHLPTTDEFYEVGINLNHGKYLYLYRRNSILYFKQSTSPIEFA